MAKVYAPAGCGVVTARVTPVQPPPRHRGGPQAPEAVPSVRAEEAKGDGSVQVAGASADPGRGGSGGDGRGGRHRGGRGRGRGPGPGGRGNAGQLGAVSLVRP